MAAVKPIGPLLENGAAAAADTEAELSLRPEEIARRARVIQVKSIGLAAVLTAVAFALPAGR